jgi:hypothetical protein
LQDALSNLPDGRPYASWRDLSPIELDDLTSECYGSLLDEQAREDFLTDEHRLSKAFGLVSHLPAAQAHVEEVAFCQMIRGQLRKLTPKEHQSKEDLDRAVRDLLDESITAQPAVDIFTVAGLPEKPGHLHPR